MGRDALSCVKDPPEHNVIRCRGASLSHMPIMPEMLQGSQQHMTSHHAATTSIQRFANSIGSS